MNLRKNYRYIREKYSLWRWLVVAFLVLPINVGLILAAIALEWISCGVGLLSEALSDMGNGCQTGANRWAAKRVDKKPLDGIGSLSHLD